MSVKDNIELVRFITERGLNNGDVSFVNEVFSADYVVHARGLDLPRGAGAFEVAVSFWRQSFPDFHTTIEHMIGEGEFVASRFSTTGTHTGALGGMPPTGKRFDVSGVDMHRVVDGKVVESWISDDMPRILMEIGVLAPAGGPPAHGGPGGPPAPGAPERSAAGRT
ncbi:MAG TPA: ester cyclase [Streptosporangiaceae bacterium]|nr:ester cyclase [Streptosporangiaceae bacterium]